MNGCFSTKQVLLRRESAVPTIDGNVSISAKQLMEKHYQQNGTTTVSIDLIPYHMEVWWEITYSLWSGDFLVVTFSDIVQLTEFELAIKQWLDEQFLPYSVAADVLDLARNLITMTCTV